MAHAEFRGATTDSRALGTGVSIGTHVVLLGLILLGATRAPGTGETPTIPIASFNKEFLNRPGLARGGGGSGNNAPGAVKRAEIPLAERREISPIPKPSDAPPVPVASIPIATVNAVEMLPGALTELSGIVPGRGTGPGGGGGRGTGAGDGDGPGAGPGQGGWLGGGIYVDGAAGLISPRLVREIKPNYTAAAVGAKVQGSILLEAVVLPDGSVDRDRIRIVRSLDALTGLDQQAILAVRGWQFRPGTFEGKPVTVRVLVELTFTLR
jgi:protein TonB